MRSQGESRSLHLRSQLSQSRGEPWPCQAVAVYLTTTNKVSHDARDIDAAEARGKFPVPRVQAR